jgi:hypothetical protein
MYLVPDVNTKDYAALQILASLDVGRAQMQLEGFRFTDDMITAAMVCTVWHVCKWVYVTISLIGDRGECCVYAVGAQGGD